MSEQESDKYLRKELRVTISPACRAKVIVAPDAVDCLTESTFQCQYRLAFGDGCFCPHPQRLEIAARILTLTKQDAAIQAKQ